MDSDGETDTSMPRINLPTERNEARQALQGLLNERNTMLVVLVNDNGLATEAERMANDPVLERQVVWARTPEHVLDILRSIKDPDGLGSKLGGAYLASIKAPNAAGTNPREIRDVVPMAEGAPDRARILEAFLAAEGA
jgi:hypothetical protein